MSQTIANLDTIKARQNATWEAGDFGEVAKPIESAAAEWLGVPAKILNPPKVA